MTSWSELERAVPELAAAARRHLDAGRHKTMATLRADGSPRISGTELELRLGEAWIGSMWGARKALDLRRDPRVAIHSASPDPGDGAGGAWNGDAKLAGRAIEVSDPEAIARWAADRGENPPDERFHLFRVDVRELVVVGLNDAKDRMVVRWWTPGGGARSVERE